MRFELDPRAKESFLNRLKAVDVTQPAHKAAASRAYEGPPPVASFEIGAISKFRSYALNKFDIRTSIGRMVDSKELVINGEAFTNLKQIASDIGRQCRLSEAVSLEFVEDVCADFVFAHHANTNGDFFDVFKRRVGESVQTYTFDFPISGLQGSAHFLFAGVQFSPSSANFETMVKNLTIPSQVQEDQKAAYQHMAAAYRRDYGRGMWGSVTVTAERNYAKIVAIDQIVEATNLLRALSVQGYHPSRHITLTPGAPLGLGEFYVYEHGNQVGFTDGADEGHEIVILSPKSLGELRILGLDRLDTLLKRENKSEMNEICLRTIHALGKAVTMPELSDKILFACTALDLLFVRGRDEPINATMPRRFAMYLGQDLTERKEIEKNIKAVYDLRSRRIHAFEKAALEESTFDFLRLMFSYAARLTLLADEFETKKAFLDSLDDRMLSG